MVASGLMVIGIGLFGVMTASIASVWSPRPRDSELQEVRHEMQALRTELAAFRRALGRPGPAEDGQSGEAAPRASEGAPFP